jgi:hypothetical protein
MSWFKHTPPKNPPVSKFNLQPHRTSPVAEKMMEEAKLMGPMKKTKKKKSSTS